MSTFALINLLFVGILPFLQGLAWLMQAHGVA
jgi:hypothetical protein